MKETPAQPHYSKHKESSGASRAPETVDYRPQRKLISALIILFALAGAALMFFVDPTRARYFPKCLSYLFTGLYCPGCGAARSAHALLHGNILKALDFNILFVAAVPVFGYLVASSLSILLRGKPLPEPAFTPTLAWLLVAVVFAFTILRNIPSSPFSWLAP